MTFKAGKKLGMFGGSLRDFLILVFFFFGRWRMSVKSIFMSNGGKTHHPAFPQPRAPLFFYLDLHRCTYCTSSALHEEPVLRPPSRPSTPHMTRCVINFPNQAGVLQKNELFPGVKAVLRERVFVVLLFASCLFRIIRTVGGFRQGSATCGNSLSNLLVL